MGSIGTPELIVILVIALVIFGPGKLPEVGKAIGKKASMSLKMLFLALKELLMKRKKPLKESDYYRCDSRAKTTINIKKLMINRRYHYVQRLWLW